MIRNIIFDYGGVVLDWNPHHLYDPYFGDRAKADWFLKNICTYEWNIEQDGGKSWPLAIEERVALFPEWEKEIRLYFDRWIDMVGGEIPGTLDLIRNLKSRGFGLYGLTNWAADTFCLVRDRYEAFRLMDGMVVSGEVKMLKPQPEIYRCLLERFSLNPSECVFIDDNPLNVAGGQAVGIHGILFKDAAQTGKILDELLK